MAENKKSILEETLAEVNELKLALEENSQNIMRSTLKEELNSLLNGEMDEAYEITDPETGEVTSSLPDEVHVDINEAKEDDEDNVGTDDLNPDEDSNAEVPEEPTDDSVIDDMGDAEADSTLDADAQPDETLGQDTPDEEIPMEPVTPDMDDTEEIEDLRGMSSDEVLSVFKKMGPEDQVVVVKDEEGIHLKDGENEYIITTGEEAAEAGLPTVDDDIMSGNDAIDESQNAEEAIKPEEESVKEEVVFEIEIPDEGKEEENAKIAELNEQLIRTRRKLAEAVAKSKTLNDDLNKVKTVVDDYKLNEGEYKQAITVLKTQLQEVAIFTSNLTYAVKLMTENSTTRAEKKQILERFDKATNLNESRLTYESLVAELTSNRKPADETVQKIIEGTQLTSGSSKINERPVYQNQQFSRIQELIRKTSK